MDFTPADIKPSLLNFAIFSLMLIIASNILKYLFVNRFEVPGLSSLVANI